MSTEYFTPTLANIVRANHREVEKFPKDEFRFKELDDDLIQMFNRLIEYGALEKTREADWGKEGRGSYWKLHDWFVDNWENYVNDGPTAPCGRTSVYCLKSGELFTCRDDDCDCRFGREKAEAIASR